LDETSEFSQKAEFVFVPIVENILRFNQMLEGDILMKTISKVLMCGVMFTASSAVTNVFAQDACADVEAKQALYAKYTANYDKAIDLRKTAVEAGKEYIAKYGACKDDAEQVNYFKKAIPDLEASIKKAEQDAAKAGEAKATQALFTRFDTAVKGNKTDEVFASGKEILAKESDTPIGLDVTLVLASVGFDQASLKTPNNTYNNDAVNYAKTAIQKLEAGKTSENFGAIQYVYKNKDFPDGKNNALGWMNYTVGYIMYNRQNQKKEALPFLYKSTQLNSATKNFPESYRQIGAWYLDEAIRIDTDRTKKITEAGNKDTEETLALLATQKGYAERAIDAYARAYKIAGANPQTAKEYKDALFTKLKELYVFRYDGKTDGIDAFVASVMNKPMPDPLSSVTPVTVTPAATTTTTSSTTDSTTTPSTTVPAAATTPKSDTTTTVTAPANKASSTTTDVKSTTNGTTATTTKATTPVVKTKGKKPVTKKKGPR
jgi:tetratricopeptide (TPR) repeat protein